MVLLSDAFNPLPAILGGLGLGVISSSRFSLWGKVTGVSGMAASLVRLELSNNVLSNAAFTAGLCLAGYALKDAFPSNFESMEGMGYSRLALAGLLVGLGTQFGSGCTSGHGICGNARMSFRSMVGTVCFMATGSATCILMETTKAAARPVPASGPWHELPRPLWLLSAGAIVAPFLASLTASSQAAATGLSRQALDLVFGAAFGTGLVVSGMLRPSKVAGFLDWTREWDPTLMFVMGGALLVALPVFQRVLRTKPTAAAEGWNSVKSAVDAPLVLGSCVFGVGWGMAGVCPGPAIVNCGTLKAEPLVFTGSMFLGFLLHRLASAAAAPDSGGGAPPKRS